MRPTTPSLPAAFLSLFAFHASAQTPDWLWARSGVGQDYDQCSAVATDPSGNVIATGYFSSDEIAFGSITLINNTPGFSDLFIVKYDPNGDVLWAQGLGGDFDDRGFSVATDASGNILLAGNFASTTITVGGQTFTNAGSPGDILLVKYDAAGNVLWATREGGPALEIPYACAFDDGGNMIVAGRFSSNSITFGTTTLLQAGSMDVFVVKYDAAGNVLWATGAGGGSNDEAYALAVRSDGDIIVAGYFTQEADFGTITLPNPGLANIFLAQCDGAGGNFEWATSVSSDGDERALSIALDASDNIYAAGYFQGDSLPFGVTTLHSTSFDNGWIARFDPDGGPAWAQGLNARSKVHGVAVANNALYACGVFRNDSLIYGSQLLLIEGQSDLFLLKSDLSGTPQWIAKQTADGESDEAAHAIASDPTGQLVVAGMFDSDVVTFGPAQLANSNGYDAFVIKTGDADVGIAGPAVGDAVALFPNPCHGSLIVEQASGARSVELFDVLGAKVLTHPGASGGRTVIDTSSLAPGPYHVRIVGDGHRSVGRILVQ